MNNSIIISHLKQTNSGEWSIQSNEDHQKGVARLAKGFSSAFAMPSFGELLGLLHDKGKESRAFQNYIKSASGYDKECSNIEEHSHAYVGAVMAFNYYKLFASYLVNPISGHHRGLYDMADLAQVLKKPIPSEVVYREYIDADELNKELSEFRKDAYPKDFHLLQRMLFSSLVDADYLDTESFMDHDKSQNRGKTDNLYILRDSLYKELRQIEEHADASDVNAIRCEVQRLCKDKSGGDRGVYSLTVPTGGGKTFSSMVWAIEHALKNGQKRIIVVIPFTSIIQQTSKILKRIFGEENVLEHHSQVIEVTDESGVSDCSLNTIAIDNWDCPIVVTTNVQFFESLFSHKPSKCRKLHNICNSVIILDEVQALPLQLLNPIVDVLDSLTRNFRCSVLLSTASQPALVGNFRGVNMNVRFHGFEKVTEIIPSELKLHERLRRVDFEEIEESFTYDSIADELSRHRRVLCIVNTRKDAFEIAKRLQDYDGTFHLSKSMHPAHIAKCIAEIKKILSENEDKDLRVISTQLIEAGVDIDFPVVFRQEAGLDSIIQAAGRCNREGRQDKGQVRIFSLREEHPLPSGFISRGNAARRALCKDCDIDSPETVNMYYRILYSRCDSFDEVKVKEVDGISCRSIQDMLYKALDFETCGENFRLITDKTVPLIIKTEESYHLLDLLKTNGPSKKIYQALSHYSVNLRAYELQRLLESGSVEMLEDNMYCLIDDRSYSDLFGLTVNNHWLEDVFIL